MNTKKRVGVNPDRLKTKKQRKPRGTKLNGYKSYDLCPCCYSRNCDTFEMSHNFNEMVSERKKNNQCVACGQEKCICQSQKF